MAKIFTYHMIMNAITCSPFRSTNIASKELNFIYQSMYSDSMAHNIMNRKYFITVLAFDSKKSDLSNLKKFNRNKKKLTFS